VNPNAAHCQGSEAGEHGATRAKAKDAIALASGKPEREKAPNAGEIYFRR
jgi:hypothetical protein